MVTQESLHSETPREEFLKAELRQAEKAARVEPAAHAVEKCCPAGVGRVRTTVRNYGIDQTEEIDLITAAEQMLGNLDRNQSALAVADDPIWSNGVDRLDLVGLAFGNGRHIRSAVGHGQDAEPHTVDRLVSAKVQCQLHQLAYVLQAPEERLSCSGCVEAAPASSGRLAKSISPHALFTSIAASRLADLMSPLMSRCLPKCHVPPIG